MIKNAIIIIQLLLLAFFVVLSLSLGAGWYYSYQAYTQPRKQAFYDGLHFMCLLVGGNTETCQRSTEKFYRLGAWEDRYELGSQDWMVTQGKEVGEVR